MSKADEAAARLEARVGKRFVEVLREFVEREVRRCAAAHGHGVLPSKHPKKSRAAVVVLRVVGR